MTTRSLRRAALLAGLFAAAAVAPAAESLPESASQKTMKADVEFLQKGLGKTPQKREIPTLKAAAMLLALNAQESKGAYREQALKVADSVAKKDFAGAKTAADAFADAKDAPGEPKPLVTLAKFELAEVMSCFRASTVGGMNLEKDIKAYGKKLGDPAQAEVVAGRVALIAVYTKQLPPAEAAGEAKKKQWDEWSDEMGTIARQIATDAGKGASADKPALEKQFVKLNANCNACHTAFRN